MALGRTSILTPATRRSAAPRARCAKAARAFRRSPGVRASSRAARTPTSSAGSTIWRPSLRSPASSCRRTIAKANRSSSTATTCRRSCSARANRSARAWFYFTEDELSPGAVRVGRFKAVFNLRGDDGQATGGLAVDSNLGWKGASKYVATVPQIFDLWSDPQERYDIFMNNLHRAHLDAGDVQCGGQKTDEDLHQIPAAQAQSETYTGPITISGYQRFQWVRDKLQQEGFDIPLPTGN